MIMSNSYKIKEESLMKKQNNLPLILLLVIIIQIQSVLAGVSHPQTLVMHQNQESEFSFAIDAAMFEYPLSCEMSLETSNTELEIKFLQNTVKIEAGSREFIKGQIKTPKDIEAGTYYETFCVSCDVISGLQGATTKPRYCGIPIQVIIERDSNNDSKQNISLKAILLIINLILLTVLAIFIKKWDFQKS